MSLIIRPRINDFHQISMSQELVDFAIPFLDEDVPLYVDPFLLWNSPSMQDQALHTSLLNSFNHLVHLSNKGDEVKASQLLVLASECNDVGLGTSKTRTGHRIGQSTANELINIFKTVPQIAKSGFTHFEEIQLYVDNISKDRISDFTCSFLKSFLIDFTIDKCLKFKIPMQKVKVKNVYDYKTHRFIDEEIEVPANPNTQQPILFTPKRWLRFVPWVNYDDYFEKCFVKESEEQKTKLTRVEVLSFNRQNYGIVSKYIETRERSAQDCKADPLFTSIPVTSAKRKLSTIRSLPSGKTDNADQKYEVAIAQLLASLFYPCLDFAQEQVRNDSGTQIRDLIFYNNKSEPFLEEIWDNFESRQLVFEMKNVAQIDKEHINQVNRYLGGALGKFGIIVTRNPLPSQMFKHTIDIWSGQRKCILALTDSDIELMVNVHESKQRKPIEVLKKKYIEFIRACPS